MTDRALVRSLGVTAVAGVQVLDCLRWPALFGSAVRLYFGSGTDLEGLATPAGRPLQLQDIRRFGRNAIGAGAAPEGQGPLLLDLGRAELEIETVAPETELFEGRDVLLAQRHGESLGQVEDWLGYHRQTFGTRAALIVDRGPPADRIAGTLSAEGYERLLVVQAPVPLGAPGLPSIHDRALARRAKTRSAQPDPWRADLAEPVLYDILRWRFLARASTVLALDPCDYLRPPEDGVDVFEAIRQSHTGCLPILGTQVYPWRVRKGQAPTRHDHICRAEPARQAPSRWAVSVPRAGMGCVWLPNAVVGLELLADEVLGYDRLASVMTPKADVAELVNKDFLVRDTDLHQAALEAGEKPVPPPSPKTVAAPALLAPPPSGRVAIVTCMKNEGPFLLDWLAYHRMIGVDDVLVYTNDCDDGTDRFLDLLASRGLVQRRDNPFRKGTAKPQAAALAAAWTEPVVREAGWVVSMDVDEYINVHVGGGRLPDLFAAVPQASLISMTWRLFGNSDVLAYEDRPVTEQFTRCAPQIIRRPHQAWGFKTLMRNAGLFKGLGVHRPRGHLGGEALWVNGSGAPMPARMFKSGWRSDLSTVGYDLVTLNHYAVRSVESFLVKRDRGRVNHVARDQGAAYWFRMNNNDTQDLSIQRHSRALAEAVAALKADPEIAQAHEDCVAAHRAKIARLRAEPDYAALYDDLSSGRMQRLSRLHRHFGMNVFLSGPSVIPDRVLDPGLPATFFFNVAAPEGPAAE